MWETKKLTNIPTGNTTKLKQIIYAEEKRVCGKTGAPQGHPNRNSESGRKTMLEDYGKELQWRVKVVRRKNTNGYIGMKITKQNKTLKVGMATGLEGNLRIQMHLFTFYWIYLPFP